MKDKKAYTKDELLDLLMNQTFHMNDAEAAPVVDAFVKRHPELLDWYEIEFLYKI